MNDNSRDGQSTLVEGDPRPAQYDDDLDGPRPDRLSAAVNRPFDDKSLVGNFFLSGHERGWQGCVVAEPAPGILLCQTYEWLLGCAHSQKLVAIDDMVTEGWSFFDDAESMSSAYEHGGVRQRWDQERGAARGEAA